ncbi:MAG: helix-turn-helix domain-containing protein [Bacteroidia bacterium]|nr:helix-turn-helix domain-containing protein [Bacteroidia bacterium]
MLVENNFRQKKSVSEYSEMLNISAGHLNDTVQHETGKTASEIIYERIILEAKRLLYHSAKSVKEIAYELLYDDPSHFNRFFKTHTGRTPEQFRKHIREKSH